MNRRLLIGYVVTPITFGGAERVSINYLKNADRNAFEILPVLLTRPWEEEPFFASELRKCGLSYRTIPVARRLDDGYFRVVRCVKEMFSICSENRFDVLHTHGYFADIITAPVSRLLGIPHISTCHGFIETDSRLRLYCRLDRLALRWCSRIIAVSSGISSDLTNGGIRRGQIVTIPNGVENGKAQRGEEDRLRIRSVLGIAGSDKVIGYAGRLSEEKGVEYLIRAGSKLRAGGRNDLKIVIVGEGPERALLEDLAGECGIADATHFVGFQPDVRSWMRAMDVFVLPSLTEGTPLALLEAMVEGIPTVASRVGDIPRIIRDGVNGLSVEPRDVDAIARGVEFLIENESKRVGLAMEAVKTIERDYGIDTWRKSIEDQYRAVLHEPTQ